MLMTLFFPFNFHTKDYFYKLCSPILAQTKLSSFLPSFFFIFTDKNKDNGFIKENVIKKIAENVKNILVFQIKKKFDKEKRIADVFSLDEDMLYEISYLLLHSQAGELLDLKGFHRIHCASFSYNDEIYICILPQGGGKSTLLMNLLKSDKIKLLSDDTPIIDRSGNIYPFPIRIGICNDCDINYIPDNFITTFNRRKFGLKKLISFDYFNSIKAVGDEVLKYIRGFNQISQEYMKKLQLFQASFSKKLAKSDNPKISQITSLTSKITEIISQIEELCKISTDDIDSRTKSFETLLKEKTDNVISLKKSPAELTKDLNSSFMEINKTKNTFINSISKTEELIDKYYVDQNKILEHESGLTDKLPDSEYNLLKEKQKTQLNDMMNSIKMSKKYEVFHKGSITASFKKHDKFVEECNSYRDKIKTIACEVADEIKTLLCAFLLSLKNNYKQPLCDADIFLNQFNILNEMEEMDKIITSSFKNDNQLKNFETSKYQLKSFSHLKNTNYLKDEENNEIKEEKENEDVKDLKEENNNKEENELNPDKKEIKEINEEKDKYDINENKEKKEEKEEKEKEEENVFNDNKLETKNEKERAGNNNIIVGNDKNEDKNEKDKEEENGEKDKDITDRIKGTEENEENNNIINNENEDEINLIKKDDSLEDEIGNIYSNAKKSKPKKIYENKPNNEYLDLLLNFVMNDKAEFNYVLSGYFANVMLTLLEKYPSQILKYLYTIRKDALRKIAFHSHQKAFSILSLKLLNLENYILVDKKIESSFKEISTESIDFRNGLIGEIIKSVSLEGIKDDKNEIKDEIDLEAKFGLVFEMINENNKVVKYLVFNNDVYSHLFDILDTDLYNSDNNSENNKGNFDNKYNIYSLFIILTTRLIKNACSNYLINYPNEFDLNSIKKSKKELTFSENMIITFGKILKNNFLPKKPTLILEKCSTIPYEGLGMLNIKIIMLVKEMMNFMKRLPKQFDSILIRNNFCQRSIDYFFKYQWNNFYQIQFVDFFNSYLSEEEKHKDLTEFLFENIKFHDALINYLNQDNIEEKDKDKIIPKQRLKFSFKSGKTINSGIYSHVIDIMYKIQAISGLDIFTEEEKSELKIKNYGEFEFSKDEKSNKFIRKINISNNVQNKLKKSKLWNEITKSTVIPLVKQYETQLCKDEEKKGEDNIELDDLDLNNLLPKRHSFGASNLLFQQLISIIKKENNPKRFSLPLSRNDKNENKDKNDKSSIREKLLNKGGVKNREKAEDDDDANNKKEEEENEDIKMGNKDDETNDSEENNKYNDTNYWEVKNTISPELKREVDKKTNIIFNYNPATYELDNKEVREEDELLSIAMGLEQNEKTEKNKKTMYIMPGKLRPINLKAKKNPVQNLYSTVKSSKNDNIEEYSHKSKDKINILEQKEEKDNKQNENEQNKKNENEQKKQEKKNIEKNDEEKNIEKNDDKAYNDVNYWNTGNYLNEKEMEDCLKDL
mgnify:CR=1 FL=1